MEDIKQLIGDDTKKAKLLVNSLRFRRLYNYSHLVYISQKLIYMITTGRHEHTT